MAKSKVNFGQLHITSVGRLVFSHIAKPSAPPDFPTQLKYSATLVVNPSEDLTKLQGDIDSLGLQAFGEEWKNKASSLYRPVLSGEDVIEKIKEPKEATISLYTNRFVITARQSLTSFTKKPLDPPVCYLADKSKMLRRPGNEDDLKSISQQFYEGSFCRLYVTPYSFVVGNTKGVNLVLKAIQFYKDGQKMGVQNVDEVATDTFSDAGPWDDAVLTEDVSEHFKDVELPDTETNI